MGDKERSNDGQGMKAARKGEEEGVLTTGPEVNSFPVWILPQNLWREVTRSPCKACKHTHTRSNFNTALISERVIVQECDGLTKPGLLVSLHLDGEAEISQFHRSSFRLGGQEQILRLKTRV